MDAVGDVEAVPVEALRATARAPVRVLAAVDKFKGTLSAAEVAEHLSRGIRAARPDVAVRALPVADGGEGTVSAALAAGFDRRTATVCGPTGEPVAADFAVRDGVAVIEMAAASGLGVLPGGRADARGATSRGTGELVAAALDAGCTTVVLGIGGSASTDGGAGMLQALGARVVDGSGADVGPGGAALAAAASVDLSGLDSRLVRTTVVLASDVDNPLTGEHGAAAVYGPQKGATADDVRALDAALAHWAQLLESALGEGAEGAEGMALTPGAGAAGGVGFGAVAALGAQFRPGVDVVLDLVGFDDAAVGTSLVVTGEGSLDAQSLHGKAPVGVARRAAARGVPVVAVAGRVLVGSAELAGVGIMRAYALTDVEPDVQRCLTQAGEVLEELAGELARDWFGEPGEGEGAER